jgi:hypothetical protein
LLRATDFEFQNLKAQILQEQQQEQQQQQQQQQQLELDKTPQPQFRQYEYVFLSKTIECDGVHFPRRRQAVVSGRPDNPTGS